MLVQRFNTGNMGVDATVDLNEVCEQYTCFQISTCLENSQHLAVASEAGVFFLEINHRDQIEQLEEYYFYQKLVYKVAQYHLHQYIVFIGNAKER
mmetsp:Transcript_36287/g.35178  ORF Transcript_36287/g.35178 Transcript_36287/m.35178 type:complete len:95 (-) Transcript_36287:286-570(-)